MEDLPKKIRKEHNVLVGPRAHEDTSLHGFQTNILAKENTGGVRMVPSFYRGEPFKAKHCASSKSSQWKMSYRASSLNEMENRTIVVSSAEKRRKT